ncbi:MAG: heme-binding protein [Hyphomicrobiaceae bacterium]|nr:heme-binding protein [Hyphomicrobiaceae bacterium]
MTKITLAQARMIIASAFEEAARHHLKPLAIVVLDDGGHATAFERQDGASAMRFKIAHGKAYGAVAMGLGSRALFERAQVQPYFISAMNSLADGALVPVPGGVLVRDGDGNLLGAVGVTGDNSDNDEKCAIAGIEAAGLVADPG